MSLPFQIEWIRDAIDILVVAFLFYRLLILVRGTRSFQMFFGLITLVALAVLAEWLRLSTLNWLIDNLRTVWLIAFIIIFQPELRKALGQITESRLFNRLVQVGEFGYVAEVQSAAERMSRKGLGALVVIERNVGLKDFVETGTKVEATVSAELIETVFTPPSPLHDGAVILQGNQLVAAGCILPLSANPDLEKRLGMRHRAAVGLTEVTDAVVLVVSEESREISIAEAGGLERDLDMGDLKSRLSALLMAKRRKGKGRGRREVAEAKGTH